MLLLKIAFESMQEEARCRCREKAAVSNDISRY